MKQGGSTKPKASDDLRRQVLDLRRRHSLREVAEATGLPLGTVKTITSRSGAFRDNAAQHALFALPPIKPSAETLPSVPELPPQRAITGDAEVDILLWLREVISTGQAAPIERAMEAAERIKTPRKDLEKRYSDHLLATCEGNVFRTFGSIGFADLEGLAARSVEKHRQRIEGRARFGDALLANTDAELFCIEALDGAKPGQWGFLDEGEVAERFKARPELLPTPWPTACMSWPIGPTCTGSEARPANTRTTQRGRRKHMHGSGSRSPCWARSGPATGRRQRPCCAT